MPKLISYLKKISIIFAVSILFYFFLDILGFVDIVRPLYQASKLRNSQNIFGVEEICSNLLKGDMPPHQDLLPAKPRNTNLILPRLYSGLQKEKNLHSLKFQNPSFSRNCLLTKALCSPVTSLVAYL